MREILFRGKCGYRNEWVEGFYYQAKWNRSDKELCHYITTPHPECDGRPSDHIMVDPSTIGQFTGLTDENDKKIFEGDIVKDESGVVYPVVYGLTGFYLKYAPPHSCGFHYDLLPLSNYWHAHGAIIEVIGNIHDNPELLAPPKGE